MPDALHHPGEYLYLESAHQWYLRKHARHAIQTGIKPAAA